ncbi:MAG: hypothetical protein WC422_01530 [Candidatus Paceibacterota bacterium]|jgi:hypothetical protein
MKIFICASKHFYDRVKNIKNELEIVGHIVTLPNSFDDPLAEEKIKILGHEEHKKFKTEMFELQNKKVAENDGILVLNFEKNGLANYIGGAVFMEMIKAFELNKKIFLYNPVPNNILKDEIEGMDPIIINGDLNLIK